MGRLARVVVAVALIATATGANAPVGARGVASAAASGDSPTTEEPVAAWPTALPESTGASTTLTSDGSPYVGVDPARLLDTRTGGTTIDNRYTATGPLGPNATIDITIAGRANLPTTGISAVVINVTAVDPTTNSYLTVYPTGTTQPNASNLNYTTGQTVPNLVTVRLGTNGQISLYNAFGTTHLLIDIVGWYPQGPGGGATSDVKVTVPDSTTMLPSSALATPLTLSTAGGISPSGQATTVRLRAGNDSPAAGSIIHVAPSPAAPEGFIGRVSTASENPDGTVEVRTVPATIQEAFPSGEAHYHGTPREVKDLNILRSLTDGCSGKWPSASLGAIVSVSVDEDFAWARMA